MILFMSFPYVVFYFLIVRTTKLDTIYGTIIRSIIILTGLQKLAQYMGHPVASNKRYFG